MRDKKEIEKAIAEIESDEQIRAPIPSLDVDGPRAVMQVRLREKLKVLKWILDSNTFEESHAIIPAGAEIKTTGGDLITFKRSDEYSALISINGDQEIHYFLEDKYDGYCTEGK